MNLLKVIPIAKNINKDELSYFSSQDVEIGDILEIEIRNKKTLGLVFSKINISEKKSEIKNLDYKIKKAGKNLGKSFLGFDFLEAIDEIAKYYATNVGEILWHFIPKYLLEKKDILSNKTDLKEKIEKNGQEVLTIQANKEERFSTYKRFIREEFAKNRSVFFCVPNSDNIIETKELLEKGIEQYTYLLYSNQKEKDNQKNWQKILENVHPVLIIGTPSFLGIPKENMNSIIIEKESSKGYINQKRPYIDMRKVVEIVAKKTKRKLIFGDLLLRTETIYKNKTYEYSELSPLKFRLDLDINCQIIDSRNKIEASKKTFEIFTNQLKEKILEFGENNSNTFIFCLRKGLYPITICGDCGETILCQKCKSPIVLYEKKNEKENYFLCHRCGEKESAQKLCPKCNSWKLIHLGIGIENTYKELKNIFPKKEIFLIDKDSLTEKEIKKEVEKFYNKTGSFLVGGETALKYLNQKIDNIIVISIDPLFAIPDFKINEKIIRLLIEMRELSLNNFYIQTRIPENKIINYAIKGNLLDFYKDEITEREEMLYPPFSIFIKISLEGKINIIKNKMEELKEFLRPKECIIFPSKYKSKNNELILNAIIQIKKDNWPDNDLIQKLKLLTPDFSIKIEPENLL